MKRLYLIQIIVLTILRTFSTTVSTSLEFPFFDVTSRGVSPLGNVSSLRNSTLQQCTFPNSAIVAPRRPITFPMAYCGTTIRTCVPFDGSSITCCWIKQRYEDIMWTRNSKWQLRFLALTSRSKSLVDGWNVDSDRFPQSVVAFLGALKVSVLFPLSPKSCIFKNVSLLPFQEFGFLQITSCVRIVLTVTKKLQES